MNKQQLEIALPAVSCIRSRNRDPRRQNAARAQWWFERMRRAVDAAPLARSTQETVHLMSERRAA